MNRSESKEEWISAVEAVRLLKPVCNNSEYEAKMTICQRARAGLIGALAETFIWGDKEPITKFRIRQDFWWAEGDVALEQNWSTGDFSTWINNGQTRLQAFGVSFLRADIDKLIPVTRTASPIDKAATSSAGTTGVSTASGALADIVRLAERLDIVVRQIRQRHDGRSTLNVADEHDLQDLFHALVKIYFDDVRKEEWNPSYAGAASRTDFWLPELSAQVELKMARQSLTARALGEQIIVDIEKYKQRENCRTVICIVYDPDGLISNPRGLEDDLNKPRRDIDVRVMIVPKR